MSIFSNNYPKNLVLCCIMFPVVNDGLPARIRALRSKDQGWQNVGEVLRGNEQPQGTTDLADRTLATLAAYSYNPVMCSWVITLFL